MEPGLKYDIYSQLKWPMEVFDLCAPYGRPARNRLPFDRENELTPPPETKPRVTMAFIEAERFPTQAEAAAKIAQFRARLEQKEHPGKACTPGWAMTIWHRLDDAEKLRLAGTKEIAHIISILSNQVETIGYLGWVAISGAQGADDGDDLKAYQIANRDRLAWITTLTEKQYNEF